ncbi:MAG: VanZ family protein [Clostridia bacterium]|nr:VanZ family protein [Clostridia bacterium]
MSRRTRMVNQPKPKEPLRKGYVIRVAVAWILVIAWMSFIFMFSAQPVEESSETSTNVSEGVAGTIEPGYNEMPPEVQEETVASYDIVIRKLAHFCEFGLLGVLFYGAVLITRNSIKRDWLIIEGSTIFVLIYAATDEIHQKYVPGRIAALKDFCIDCLGAVTGVVGLVALMWMIELILNKRKKVKEKSSADE